MTYEDAMVGQYVVSGPEMGREMAGRVSALVWQTRQICVTWDDGHVGILNAEDLVLDTRYAQPITT